MSGRALKLGVVLLCILDLAWYLLIAGGSVGVLAMIVILARGGHVQADVPVAFRAQSAGTAPGRAASLMNLTGTLRTPASALAAVLILGFTVIAWGLVLFALRQLRLVVGDTLAGSPFTPPNARRIGLLGLTIVAADLVRALVLCGASLWARSHVHLPGVTFPFTFPVQVLALVAGLLVILLAEVFRIGHALQQDRDLTI